MGSLPLSKLLNDYNIKESSFVVVWTLHTSWSILKHDMKKQNKKPLKWEVGKKTSEMIEKFTLESQPAMVTISKGSNKPARIRTASSPGGRLRSNRQKFPYGPSQCTKGYTDSSQPPRFLLSVTWATLQFWRQHIQTLTWKVRPPDHEKPWGAIVFKEELHEEF